MSTIREQLRHAGFKAHKLLCQDPNGGVKLIDGWLVLRPDQDTPRPGEVMGRYATREDAWRAAEDYYTQAY